MTTLALNTSINSLNQRIASVDAKFKGNPVDSWMVKCRTLVAVFLPTVISKRYAKQIDAMAEELSRDFMWIAAVRQAVSSTIDPLSVIDPEMKIDGMLESMKASLDRIAKNSEAAADAAPSRFSQARDAMTRLGRVAQEIRASVNALQWEIGEHDAPLLGRVDGPVAESREQLDALLERICSA